MKKREKNKMFLVLILLITITIGYAAIATTLKINGTSDVKRATWNVHWQNPNVVEGSTSQNVPVLSENNTVATFTATLTEPGDFYEFTIEAINEGSLDAMIETISSKMNGEELNSENLPAYLEYSITYDNGSEIKNNDELNSGDIQVYRVKLKYRQDVDPSVLEELDHTFNFEFSLKYVQKRGNQTPKIKLCRRTTNLHKETCNADDNNYCKRTHQTGEEIVYGNLSNTDTLNVGDALDCDVDGNNRYDADERFYYLRTLNNKEVLVFYSNVEKGNPNNKYYAPYDSDGNPTVNGPKTAILDLPTEKQWRRVKLLNNTRDIYDNNSSVKLSNFSYNGYAARLLNVNDLDAGCNSNLTGQVIGNRGALDNCEFLYENTAYADGNSSTKLNSYWIENIFQYNTNLTYIIATYSGNLGTPSANSTNIGVRPVIEVNLSDIEL